MRKLWVAVAAIIMLLAVAAIAIAQQTEVTNTYKVEGSTSPAREGSARNPVPIQIDFDYEVGTTDGRRPSPIEKYSIRFGGVIVNQAVAPRCSKTTLDNEGPSGCPRGSIVGSGFIENETGNRSDPNDKSITCNASVQVINGPGNGGNLYVAGSPNSTDPRTRCAIELAAPIPFRFVRRGSAIALEFEVPDTLLHPLPTLSNAVKRVQSRVRRITRRIRGKRRGYFESRGPCPRNRRLITVVFDPEEGEQATAQDRAPCR
ncbi:MAG TPA: hypothetical protein VHF89_17515 [Solirubrobacteraceae bacterium]|nr:hypothetical protein [Solirubrobacteraceae bacterium]